MIVGEKLLSLKEVADHLQLSERTIFNLIKRGDLEGIQIGKRWRFSPETVQAYMDRLQQEQTQKRQQAPGGSVA